MVLEGEMESRKQQEPSRYPAMVDIQSNIGNAAEHTDQISFAGKGYKERDLSGCKPSSADSEKLPVSSSCNIVVDELQNNNEDKVCEDDIYRSEWRDLEPR